MTVLVWVVLAIQIVALAFSFRARLGLDRGPVMALFIGLWHWLGIVGMLTTIVGIVSGTWWLWALGVVALADGVDILARSAAPGLSDPDRRGPPLRVITANIYYRNPNGGGSWPALEASEPDVVLLQEVSAMSGSWLPPPGWHCASVLRDDAFGTAILTREPLQSWNIVDLDGLPQLRAVLRHGGHDVVLYCVHPRAPATRAADAQWRRQFQALSALVQAEDDNAIVVVGGDFNASPLHRPFTALLRETGLVDARESGWGFDLTWPSGGAGSPFGLPLVMALDHVLVRNAAIRDVKIQGATTGDHLPVAIEIGLPVLD
jgi:endonuclease/exonuclease/phosphatase family metal-dependent hydrolase